MIEASAMWWVGLWRGGPVRKACVWALAASAPRAGAANAQIQLPGIVVTTPSPVTRPSRPPQATPAAASDTLPSSPGLIVEDAFVPITVVPSGEITGTPG